jgi:leucyl aminopeptidase
MPLIITSDEKNLPADTLLAFSKNSYQAELVQLHAGLNYKPKLPVGAKEVTHLLHSEKNSRIWVLGLGDEADAPKVHISFRSFLVQHRQKSALQLTVRTDQLDDHELFHAVIGLRLGMINHGLFRTNGAKFIEPQVTLLVKESRKNIVDEASIISDVQMQIMELVDQPSNKKTPQFIAARTMQITEGSQVNLQVIAAEKLQSLGMEALLSVGQGSIHRPLMLVMEYNGKNSTKGTPDLGLVGKGITFDTGGISIKPSANMAFMKSDMAGAAAVIGAITAAARLQLPIHLVGVIPVAENSVDAHSMRPGDVISSYSGKSIEVIDTDAEGRLILADGLSYIIRNFQPKQLIDLATLTGSCIATLGNAAAGMFTNNHHMADTLAKAGEKVNEKVWRLPLWEDYMADMQSEIADIKNLSAKPVAGAITAAKFLEFFTEKHEAWVHLDIAGVAFTESEFAKSRTATGFGVRLLLSYMQQYLLSQGANIESGK